MSKSWQEPKGPMQLCFIDLVKIPGIHIQFLFVVVSPAPRGDLAALDKWAERLSGFTQALVGRRCRNAVSQERQEALFFHRTFHQGISAAPSLAQLPLGRRWVLSGSSPHGKPQARGGFQLVAST